MKNTKNYFLSLHVLHDLVKFFLIIPKWSMEHIEIRACPVKSAFAFI